jgi:two-component system, OmpR family, sensor histidine kinase BaeS
VNRLVTRLGFAMAAVVIAGIVVVVGAQMLMLRQQFDDLPDPVRIELEQIWLQRDATDDERLAQLESVFAAWVADPASREAVFEALSAARRPGSQGGLLLAALGSILFGVVVGGLAAERIARPIAAVAQAADRVARGDLAARVGRAPSRAAGDEVALLGRSFDTMAEALQRSEQQRQALVADVAHELRTPLAVLQGRLEALLDGVLPVDRPELERLHRQTRLLARLVEDLRVLSLADAQQLDLALERVDLVAVAAETVAAFASRAAERGVRLVLHAATPEVHVPADPHRMAQVLGNLIDNAIRITPSGGTVAVRVERTRDTAVVAVEDDGPGLPPGDAERLFDRFHRPDASRARASGGSGLGLAIVRTLVEAHGGRVGARDRDVGGAAFEVVLPIRDHRSGI